VLENRNSLFGFHLVTHIFLFQKLVFLFNGADLFFSFLFVLLYHFAEFFLISFFILHVLLLKLLFLKLIIIFQLHYHFFRFVIALSLPILCFFSCIFKLHFQLLDFTLTCRYLSFVLLLRFHLLLIFLIFIGIELSLDFRYDALILRNLTVFIFSFHLKIKEKLLLLFAYNVQLILKRIFQFFRRLF
jgi:hypothetical protein